MECRGLAASVHSNRSTSIVLPVSSCSQLHRTSSQSGGGHATREEETLLAASGDEVLLLLLLLLLCFCTFVDTSDDTDVWGHNTVEGYWVWRSTIRSSILVTMPTDHLLLLFDDVTGTSR